MLIKKKKEEAMKRDWLNLPHKEKYGKIIYAFFYMRI
jgi:hypothetical protein